MGHSFGGLFASRPRRILVAAAIIIALLGAGTYAYWVSLPSPIGPRVTLTSPPLEISMTLDKTQYSLAENMTITFYLRNISNKTVTLVRPRMTGAEPGGVVTAAEGVTILPWQRLLDVLVHFGIILYDSNGTMISRIVDEGYLETYDIVLQPNASLNQTTFVNLSTTINENGRIVQRASGAYAISAALYAVMNGTGVFTWETPSITFTLG